MKGGQGETGTEYITFLEGMLIFGRRKLRTSDVPRGLFFCQRYHQTLVCAKILKRSSLFVAVHF